MSCATSIGAHAFMTMYLLFVTGCTTQKVYFDCGAKVDVVDVQGLILSPGFPYNYSSGIHCVWQFFVPMDYQLVLEMFDFDVFESHDSPAVSYSEEELTEEEMKTLTPRRLAAEEDDEDDNEEDALSLAKVLIDRSEQVFAKGTQSSNGDEVQDMRLQEELMKIEGDHVSESAKRASDKEQPDTGATPRSPRLWIPVAQPPGGEASDSSISTASSSSPLSPPLGGLHSSPSSQPGAARTSTTTTTTTATASPSPQSDTASPSPETAQPMLDACPHDVLYISDLITFSSRFCGSNRPPGGQLVFGSSQEMVEVIMELITTTHWGRGFALLFHYHNLTEPGGDRRTYAHAPGRMDTLLAAVSAAVFFGMILASALCMIFRPKLCPKISNSCVSSNSEVAAAVENPASEVSELRVVTANEGEREVSEGQLAKRPAPGDRRTQAVSTGGEASRELELSPGGLMELDLGADEVFITASDPSHPGLPLSAHSRERYLRYSDTGPRPLSDWPLPDPAATTTSSQGPTAARTEGGSGCSRPRPRAWSVRTFQDYLPPLHKKWCSWNSSSPFTKLVDTTLPSLGADRAGDNGRKVFSEAHLSNKPSSVADSAVSSASYPLTLTAHQQRRLNSTSNLRRSLFNGFGLLCGTDDPAGATPGAVEARAPGPASSSPSGQQQQPQDRSSKGGKRRNLSTDGTDHVSVPVFAISEEEDREPLVPAEHLAQTSFSSISLSPSSSSTVNGQAGGLYQERRLTPLC
ncbi:uncharacterized protein si:dkey-112e17.1 isoform X1 [Gadus morhua]|uniref:uncharacterized protein si:dkey-112e17.1 isoform X1 n=1 Tax=Gadus morhua TaxID=8049 RepID=UPI0011B5ED0C|nr:uncharacterized protein LOC115545287 isoform X1 [Gadus morhua]